MRIEYGTVSLAAASKVRFRYMLEGLHDDSWSTGAYLEYRPSTSLTVSAGPDLSFSKTAYQNLGSYTDATATETYGLQ